MATIVQSRSTGEQFAVLGAGFGMVQATATTPVFGGPSPSSKVGKEQLLAVSNAQGEPGFIPLEEVEVISIDGVAPKELLTGEHA